MTQAHSKEESVDEVKPDGVFIEVQNTVIRGEAGVGLGLRRWQALCGDPGTGDKETQDQKKTQGKARGLAAKMNYRK